MIYKEEAYNNRKRINVNLLQKGDIILTTSNELQSCVIKKFTNSDISHAMVCVSRSSVMDSTGNGVHARNPEKIFYPNNCSIHILRPKNIISNYKLDQAINYIRDNTGVSYSLSEAISSIFKIGNGSEKQFCSRLVARAYAYIGINLVENPNYCTPEDLKKSALLKFIEPSFVVVDEDEKKQMENLNDTSLLMISATEELLEKIRKIPLRVSSINDIYQVAINHPWHDPRIAEALIESGYLYVFDIELENYSWRYSQDLIVNYYYYLLPNPDALLDYCHNTIIDHKSGTFNHWKRNLIELKRLNTIYPRKTFDLFINLYSKLNRFQDKRVEAAKYIIKLHK
jgi:hypothetical protein